MYIVRYADDFKIFCKDSKTAQKTLEATKQWLKERLHLDISSEKSGVTNLRKKYTEFLGFKLKVHKKGGKQVVESHMSDKAIKKVENDLIEQVKAMQRPKNGRDLYQRVGKYNSMVIGMHNYYALATHVSLDFSKIGFRVRKVIHNRLKLDREKRKGSKKPGRIRTQGQIGQKYIKERYGGSKQMRWTSGIPIVPVAYVQGRNPMNKKRNVNPYTEAGRQEIHKNLTINPAKLRWLMQTPIKGRTMEYNDNRISLYVAQKGRCAVTGKELEPSNIHCHHKTPKHRGGKDNYQNLTLVHVTVHRLIHATNAKTIKRLMEQLNLTDEQLKKLNKLRATAGLEQIERVASDELVVRSSTKNTIDGTPYAVKVACTV